MQAQHKGPPVIQGGFYFEHCTYVHYLYMLVFILVTNAHLSTSQGKNKKTTCPKTCCFPTFSNVKDVEFELEQVNEHNSKILFKYTLLFCILKYINKCLKIIIQIFIMRLTMAKGEYFAGSPGRLLIKH